MKLLQFAIASLVAANTGKGLQGLHRQHGAVRTSLRQPQQQSYKPGLLRVLLGKLYSRVVVAIEAEKQHARLRRDTRQVLDMSVERLRDIGLNQNDVHRLRLGYTSLASLNHQRKAYRSTAAAGALQQPTTRVDSKLRDLPSANEAHYQVAECC